MKIEIIKENIVNYEVGDIVSISDGCNPICFMVVRKFGEGIHDLLNLHSGTLEGYEWASIDSIMHHLINKHGATECKVYKNKEVKLTLGIK